MLNTFRYIYYRLRHPDFSDFIAHGMGLASREKQARADWANHLQRCLDAEAQALAASPDLKHSLAVLGAGRLFDFNAPAALAACKEIALYDADPGARSAWRQLQKQAKRQDCAVTFHLGDLSGCVLRWSGGLDATLQRAATWEAVFEYLSAQRAGRPPRLAGSPTTIFSLNILSQLPLFLRDRLLRSLHRAGLLRSEDDDPPEQIRVELQRLYKELQEQHLSLLNESGADTVLVLTDLTYCYYLPEGQQREQALAMAEPSLQYYTLQWSDRWRWDIAPPGTDGMKFGTWHEVGGYRFSRS